MAELRSLEWYFLGLRVGSRGGPHSTSFLPGTGQVGSEEKLVRRVGRRLGRRRVEPRRGIRRVARITPDLSLAVLWLPGCHWNCCLLGHAEDGGTAQRRLVLRELASRHRRPGSPCRFPAHFSGRPVATMSGAGVAPLDWCESEPTEGTRRADLERVTPGRRTAQTPISPYSLKKKKIGTMQQGFRAELQEIRRGSAGWER